MHTSTEGLMFLVAHEGIVLTPYKDSVGVWTLGWTYRSCYDINHVWKSP